MGASTDDAILRPGLEAVGHAALLVDANSSILYAASPRLRKTAGNQRASDDLLTAVR
jgi:hypothetical protein